MQFGKPIRQLWHLDDDIIFLNHGTFGACPKEVLEAQQQWRLQLEREPVQFLLRELPNELANVRQILGEFVGANADDLALVENATTGANAVIRSLAPSFKPGDELLTTSHGYGAIRQTLQYAADTTGAVVIDAAVPFPITDAEEIVSAIKNKITDRTKFAIIDHITSPTGIIFPIEKIIPIFNERGIPIMIDGAHVPGMIDLDLSSLGADYFTGNCHKWLYTPKGSAFLWVDKKHQSKIHPTVISHDYGNGYMKEFDWTGTLDPTAWLSIPAGITFQKKLGVQESRKYGRALILEAREKLNSEFGLSSAAPDELLGNLYTIPFEISMPLSRADLHGLRDKIFANYKIEVPALTANGKAFLRISANAYNYSAEYDALIAAMKTIFAEK